MNRNKDFYIDRTYSEVKYSDDGNLESVESNRVLADYRNHDAYVLLGEPGAGKTETFEYEGDQPGCLYIKSRELIAFDIQNEWKSKILFIDGLDEVRAGANNGLIPLDAIRNKLLQLGKPKFRLSCREADWLDSSDRLDLQKVTDSGQVSVLHLEALNEEDIKRFTREEEPELDIQKFMDWSHKHVLMPMLGNPQILRLIIKSVSEGKWPESKKEVYRVACDKLVLETNQLHQIIDSKKSYSAKEILDGAGKLFAHQLIAGLEGFSLLNTIGSKQSPYYGNIFGNNIEVLENSLKTNLFKQGSDKELREPSHRSIAEYLAADYLTDLVEDRGLPPRRLLSLITSSDGSVVSSLRGMFSWFLTLCAGQRSALLDRDPLGAVLYGDVTAFSTEQKTKLFLFLYKEAEKHPGFRSENRMSSPFGALATIDMQEKIKIFLESPSRDPANQSLVHCALDAVIHGAELTGLTQPLLNIIKDYTWWSGIRRTALKALLKLSANDQPELIMQLLEEIQNNKIEDREDELLGTLLDSLYPQKIKPGTIFNYFHSPKDGHFFGRYQRFWMHTLVEKTDKQNIPELLDQLSRRAVLKEFFHRNSSLYGFVGELVVNGVIQFGDMIKIDRLYDWLGVGLDKYDFSILDNAGRGSNQELISKWLSDRPEAYKAIIAEGVSRYVSGQKTWRDFHGITTRLYNATAPDDIGEWYLNQSEKMNNEEIAMSYFQEAVRLFYSGLNFHKFNLDNINTWVKKHPEYDEKYQSMLVENGKQYQKRLERAKIHAESSAGQAKKKTDYLNYIIENKNAIETGLASPAIFHDLAFAYYGHLIDATGETAHERVSSIVNGSKDLTKLALSGLKKTIFRHDLPTLDEIIKTSIKGKTFYISHAVLAGMEERKENSIEWQDINDDQYEKAIAFQLVEHTGDTPVWFTQLLRTKTDLVSKALVKYVGASIRSGKEHISGLYQLAHEDDWSEVAKESVLFLLEKFPVRTKNTQTPHLENLLKAALRYSDQSALLKLIEKKLRQSSMNMMQRSRWLSSGLMLAPEDYEIAVNEFMEFGITRVRSIASFFTNEQELWRLEIELPLSTLGMFIQQLGSHFKPYSIKGVSRVTMEMDEADKVPGYIRKLARIDKSEAALKLEELIQMPELEAWRYQLKSGLYEHTKRLREVSFIQPNIESVLETLSNKAPANAADLMAIALDALESLAEKIRNSSTNDFTQYWNTDQNGKTIIPKVEDVCRDALLSDLKTSLEKLNINAEKEGYFANDKRSDIKITYLNNGRIVIPVEIKRDFHKDVWKALWTQLIKQYTQGPDTQGYGVYVVFWFGTGKTPIPPEGKKPSSAKEMKEALLGMMSEEEKRLIGLCVIDLSVNG